MNANYTICNIGYTVCGVMTIGEINLDLNFSDASHFIKFFYKLYGQRPTEYRNSHSQPKP